MFFTVIKYSPLPVNIHNQFFQHKSNFLTGSKICCSDQKYRSIKSVGSIKNSFFGTKSPKSLPEAQACSQHQMGHYSIPGYGSPEGDDERDCLTPGTRLMGYQK